MKLYKYLTMGAVAIAMAGLTSCVGDLDLTPTDPTPRSRSIAHPNGTDISAVCMAHCFM